MTTRDLLIEIGTEELPPKALSRLSEAFSAGICSGLDNAELKYTIATPYATPRRLAIIIRGLETEQADREVEKRGPAVKAAFKEGVATKAAEGFARSCGTSVDKLDTLATDKGEWLVFRSVAKGKQTTELLTAIIESALAALPIPKRMRWADLNTEFVRPAHWIIVLFGDEVVDTEILGIKSGRETRGHRFLHPETISLNTPNDYVKALEETGKVFPTFSIRKKYISDAVLKVAEEHNAEAVIDADLLDEVTGLVEYPVAITGDFDEKFLDVPAEALVSAMKEHQKYFHMIDSDGKLLPKFITISNIPSKQPEVVKTGNERVIRPRLSDAMFFWEQDKAHPLADRLDRLKTIVFQNKLGTLYDKSQRVAELAGHIAKQLGADELQGIRAAQLAKCDLTTEMVGEFPDLQGTMGEYYARHDKETDAVATALREQYMPRFWGDDLPATPVGQALAIADRLDTIMGIFGIGQAPTGDKDPFGLRRAALGILRIMSEQQLNLDINELLTLAEKSFAEGIIAEGTSEQVYQYMLERLRGYYQEQGINPDSIEAVLSCRPARPLDAIQRVKGVEAFRTMAAAESLASANKRIHNLLKKNVEPLPAQPDPTYFNHAAERALFDKMETVKEVVTPLLASADYTQALEKLAELRETVDTFFDDVMVMDEDPTVRKNRLAFLQSLRQLFLHVADISCLQR